MEVGDIVWAKVHKKGTCWPGLVVDGPDCGQDSAPLGKVWIYWFGDHRFTQVQRSHVFDFKTEFSRFFKKNVGKGYDAGVVEALKECGKRLGKLKDGLSRSVLLDWAYNGFANTSEIFENSDQLRNLIKSNGNVAIPSHIRRNLRKYRQPVDTNKQKEDSDAESVSSVDCSVDVNDPRKLGIIEAIRNKSILLSDVCLACFTVTDDLVEHPLFNAFLCSRCLRLLKEFLFAIGTDGNNYNCIICLGVDPVLIYMCSQPNCFRSYCQDCLRVTFPVSVKEIKSSEDWLCFMCTPYSEDTHGFIQPLYDNWKLNVWEMFHKDHVEAAALQTDSVRILFTGGNVRSVRLTIERLSKVGIQVSAIFVSGFFEKDAVLLQRIFPDKLNTIPAPWDLDEITLLKYYPIDIVVGGSRELYSDDPSDKKSMNAVCVFDDFHRILSDIKGSNVVSSVFWTFEFEEPICAEFYGIISRVLNFEPARWESTTDIPVSILVWTNVSALWTLLKADGLPPKNDTYSLKKSIM